MGTSNTPNEATGKETLDEKVQKLEERLDKLLSGEIDLTVVELGDLQVSPRSKLRVACE
ncbi:hypothetical protein [Chenggangzhangella methanolivorans]|uniref:Uncharacterized protein n=1 Tax=Chenggangzhangella methanolivorans TaxID=1437009 RepID=A0A9E6UGU4_9HYPH|nr:hypothetical protein [Chenggangzhangella methanolivorans]QZN99102.1 hypothetical protein K6K41_19965 [Chenggangzhangella methanolivorans]